MMLLAAGGRHAQTLTLQRPFMIFVIIIIITIIIIIITLITIIIVILFPHDFKVG